MYKNETTKLNGQKKPEDKITAKRDDSQQITSLITAAILSENCFFPSGTYSTKERLPAPLPENISFKA